jgi:hypothetical protein
MAKGEMAVEWSGPLSRRVVFQFKGIGRPGKINLVRNEEPEKTLELQGMWMGETYVLALPDTAGARLVMRFPASSRRKPG